MAERSKKLVTTTAFRAWIYSRNYVTQKRYSPKIGNFGKVWMKKRKFMKILYFRLPFFPSNEHNIPCNFATPNIPTTTNDEDYTYPIIYEQVADIKSELLILSLAADLLH